MGSNLSKISGARDEGDFVVGKESFDDLDFNPALKPKLRYIYNKKKKANVEQFVLAKKPQVEYVCRVTIIEIDNRFTPRLAFSIRDETGRIAATRVDAGEETYNLKANIDLGDCHDNFWKLVSFLGSLKEIYIPKGRFSLISHNERDIVSALREREVPSLVNIIRELLASPDVSLSRDDVNQLLKRKEKLLEFEKGLETDSSEDWWQDFFEQNKWIFGYGLNYQILRQEQPQAHLGGTRSDGGGGHKGDYLASTEGSISFTVLVEIKTPGARLLQGIKPIRSGAWSLSRDLTDAVAQIEANICQWAESGSKQNDNRDRFEERDVYTVQPKGIIVIGSLNEVSDLSDTKDQRAKRETFQRFRKSIHGIDIITFDELYKRAAFIVKQTD